MESRATLARILDRVLTGVLVVLGIATLIELLVGARTGDSPWLLSLGVACILFGATRMYFNDELAELSQQGLQSGRRGGWLGGMGYTPGQIFNGGLVSAILGVFVVLTNLP